MPLQRKIQIATLIFIIILIALALVMQFGQLNARNLLMPTAHSSPAASLMELTDQNVLQAVNSSSLLVLDFYYPGCGPCEYLNKTTSELSNELQGQIKFGKMNIKANGNTAKKYKITFYPTLLFFDQGILLDRIKGNISKSDLLARIKEFKADLDTSKVKLQVAYMNVIPLASFGEVKPTMPMSLCDDNLDLAIKKYPYLVVDAYTPWCEYCHYLNTTILELSSELQGQVAFGLIDAEKSRALMARYNFTAYPTLLVYKDGKMVDKLIGNRAKSAFVSELKKYNPNLDISMVKIVAQPAIQFPSQPKQTPQQICANMTKSDQPLLEAFIVSRCPFGLQMQRIMASIISKFPKSKDYMKVRYIGSVNNGIITSMHGSDEANENLRQICIRDEQSDKYWDYVSCYMKEDKSADCLKSVSIDQGKLVACINDDGRGLAYAQKDFDLASQFQITASPTLTMNGEIVSEFDFATNSTNGRSPEALKELLCCGFYNQPAFCSQELDKTQAITMFDINVPTTVPTIPQTGRDINLTGLGEKSPSQAMLVMDDNIKSAESQYPLLVVEAFANWCGFCRMMNVTIGELATELQGQVAFGLIDAERNNETKTNYNITAYPTSLIFKEGKLVDTVVGNQQKSSFVARLKQIEPKLDISKVKIVQSILPISATLKPNLTS